MTDGEVKGHEKEVKGYDPAVFVSESMFEASKSQKEELVEVPFGVRFEFNKTLYFLVMNPNNDP